MLVSLTQWQLLFGRDLVKDNPLPWQPTQENPTPERVLQGFAGLFREIVVPRLPHRKRADSRRDGLEGGLALDQNATEWSKRARKSPNRPETGAKLDC